MMGDVAMVSQLNKLDNILCYSSSITLIPGIQKGEKKIALITFRQKKFAIERTVTNRSTIIYPKKAK